MKLIVISPEDGDERELPALPRLFAAGLAHYHLRKPAWSRERLAAFIRVLPPEFHPRLMLHTHHDLAAEFAVGGLHERENTPPVSHAFTSRAAHTVTALRSALGHVDRVLLSPIFPSISKPSHLPRLPLGAVALTLAERSVAERRTEVVALGGVDAGRIAECRALRFDGAALLGAVWNKPDPMAAFTTIVAYAR